MRSISRTLVDPAPPARLRRTSTRPNAAIASSAIRFTWSGSVTSARNGTTRPASGLIRSMAVASAWAATSTITTFMPASIRQRTLACPIAPAPPVTIAARRFIGATLSSAMLARYRWQEHVPEHLAHDERRESQQTRPKSTQDLEGDPAYDDAREAEAERAEPPR